MRFRKLILAACVAAFAAVVVARTYVATIVRHDFEIVEQEEVSEEGI